MEIKKKKKVIYIDIPTAKKRFHEDQENDKWINGWGSLLGRNILKYTDEFVFETWHYDREINKVEWRVLEGIKGVLFPVNRFNGSHFPLSMYRKLREIIKREESFLLHMSFIYNKFVYFLVYLLGDEIPFIVSSHGDMRPDLKFEVYKRIRYLLEKQLIAPVILKKIKIATFLRKDDQEYLGKYIDKDKVFFQTVGVDFDEFKPYNKLLCRKEFNLPIDKKILIYIGKVYEFKGIHLLLPLIEKLRAKNIELLIVGAESNHELYEAFEKKDVIMLPIIPHSKIPKVLSAADAYITPGHNIKYRGLDVSNLEALACNVPVISPNISHLPGDYNKYGHCLEDKGKLFESIMEVLSKPEGHWDIREKVKDHISWETIVKRMVKIYNSYLV